MRAWAQSAILGFIVSLGWLAMPAYAEGEQDDVDTLLAITRISEWLGEPVRLEAGLCVLDAYGAAWPAAAQRREPGDRELQRLQGLLAQCAHHARFAESPSMNLNDRGLLTRLRSDYQQRVKRLTQRLAAQQQACGALAADSMEMKECLQRQTARPLSPQQQQGLLDLGRPVQGSSSGTR